MVLNLLTFFVGTTLLMLVAYLVYKRRNDRLLSGYFLIIMGIAGLQRTSFALAELGVIAADYNLLNRQLALTIFIPPIYFFCSENLYLKQKSIKKELTLFVIALLIFGAVISLKIKKPLSQVIFLIYSTSYLFFILKNTINYFTRNKTSIAQEHFESTKKWALILIGLFFTNYLFSNYSFNTTISAQNGLVLLKFNNSTSPMWLCIVIYMFVNPRILYGKENLLKVLNTPLVTDLKLWNISKAKATEKLDLKIEKKVKPNVQQILFLIREFENELLLHFNEVPTLSDFSKLLNHPQTHLKYIFKYYCNYSYASYQNALRIKYAFQLINQGYLEHHTVDALGKKCLFSSRITFFNNFKKITGYSTTEYILQHSFIP